MDIHNPSAHYSAKNGGIRAFEAVDVARVGNNKPVCQICGKQGHVALRCWHQIDEDYQASANPNGYTSGAKSAAYMATPPAAYIATPKGVMDPSWYADNGATNQVTANMENLTLTAEYGGQEKLMIGNGKCLNISHIGHSTLPTLSSQSTLHLKNVLRVPKIAKILVSISKLLLIMISLLNFIPMYVL